MTDPRAAEKRHAAEAAVAEIEPGMIVGLGTGSTAAFAVAALARRVADGLVVDVVATSLATESAARAQGIAVRDFGDVVRIDLAIDGADEVDPQFRAIKGAGGAMLREKIVAAAADRMISIVDRGKMVEHLGIAHPLPIEVLPFARAFVVGKVEALGARATERKTLSDQGNLLIDCAFAGIADPTALASSLSAIPGVLGHGLFLDEIDAVFIGGEKQRERR